MATLMASLSVTEMPLQFHDRRTLNLFGNSNNFHKVAPCNCKLILYIKNQINKLTVISWHWSNTTLVNCSNGFALTISANNRSFIEQTFCSKILCSFFDPIVNCLKTEEQIEQKFLEVQISKLVKFWNNSGLI